MTISSGVAFAQEYGLAGLFHDRCVVRKFGAVLRLVGAAQYVGAEYLRGLYDAQAAAVDDA